MSPANPTFTRLQMLKDPVIIVKHWIPCVFFLCLLVQVNAFDSDQCSEKFANETGQLGPSMVTKSQCVEMCGGGNGGFQWSRISRNFGSWLLPWIALIFQLPFGGTGT